MYRILIIEDDDGIAKAISDSLLHYRIDSKIVDDFYKVMEIFRDYEPHLVLLDINLPFYDGYHYCQEIRKLSKLPIIFISSANSNMNISMAMNMGGDDFITKPFDIAVLVAKILAHLRRCYDFNNNPNIISHDGIDLNLNDNTLTYKERNLQLTKNEFRIILTLIQNKGKIVSREKLMEVLWQNDEFVDENTLNVNVNRLRKKLQSIGIKELIQTRFGLGYII